ncbi:MAG: tetratricopeptide repeat protein [Bacteroidetes bacterium]|nr:tetratricopeptide repeat protein [Bacteroidota bacterium]
MMFAGLLIQAQPANKNIEKGNDAYRKGDYSNAIEMYKEVLRKDPANTIARFNLANALQKRNEMDDANKNYDLVIKESGNNVLAAESNYNKGLAFVKEKNLEEAIAAFKQSLRENSSDDDTRENLQKALNDLKKQQQQNQPNRQQQNQQQKPKQQKQPPLNKDMMQQKFNELRNQEKQLQQKLLSKNNTAQPDKDW